MFKLNTEITTISDTIPATILKQTIDFCLLSVNKQKLQGNIFPEK